MEDSLPLDIVVEDEWGLWDISPSGAVDVQSKLRGEVSVIQKKCSLYGLDVLAKVGGVF